MHYVHECERQHIWIRQKKCIEIVAKLQQVVHRENILYTIKNSLDYPTYMYMEYGQGLGW